MTVKRGLRPPALTTNVQPTIPVWDTLARRLLRLHCLLSSRRRCIAPPQMLMLLHAIRLTTKQISQHELYQLAKHSSEYMNNKFSKVCTAYLQTNNCVASWYKDGYMPLSSALKQWYAHAWPVIRIIDRWSISMKGWADMVVIALSSLYDQTILTCAQRRGISAWNMLTDVFLQFTLLHGVLVMCSQPTLDLLVIDLHIHGSCSFSSVFDGRCQCNHNEM